MCARRARSARSPRRAEHGPGMMYDLYSPSGILPPPEFCTGTVDTPRDAFGFLSMPCSFRCVGTNFPTTPFGSSTSLAKLSCHSEPETLSAAPVSVNRQPLASSSSVAWFTRMITGSSTMWRESPSSISSSSSGSS
eukprot:16450344-Heterocapsa_arctica.AAC.1